MKKTSSKKLQRYCWHRNKISFIKIFNLLLLFAVLTCGRRVQYGNVVV